MTSSERKARLIQAARDGRSGRLRVERPDLGRGLPTTVHSENGEHFEGDEFEMDLRELVDRGVFLEESVDVYRLVIKRP